ncbi:hypothetical protein N0B16_11710 [Chryseobacterium sp. GMJ5]|uniref:Uncharacterized protein n=1 Tax=Chryseobacterium gilvum TaxID=2976534 RepID=A0ABT2VYN1_9FLAO|nr:hypothetical protein [Chryseobacterium gilvum]MCU7615106.1 hypothetical protein [Chryseobacterium gilvum]
MKKILIIGSVVLSGLAFSQQQSSENSYVYDEPEVTEGDTFPGNPGDPTAAPIDQYVPVLLLTAIGMVVVFAKRKKTAV